MSDLSPPPHTGADQPLSDPPGSEATASGRSRRWFLIGGAAVLLGGGAGVLAEVLHESSPPVPAPPPGALVAAYEAERVLLATVDAMTGVPQHARPVLAQLRADHAAHLRALRRLLATYPRTRKTPSSPGTAQPRTLGQLRGVEDQAAVAAAHHAAALDGPAAALLASIAACEATHAELLR